MSRNDTKRPDLGDYPVCVEDRVRWGEMDAYQHVNNSVYFRYFEHARIRLMEATGLLDLMENENKGVILARIDANFRAPLTYPDTIRTYVRFKGIGKTSFVVEHVIWSEKLQRIVCDGEGVGVLIDYGTGEKVPVTEEIMSGLKPYILPDRE